LPPASPGFAAGERPRTSRGWAGDPLALARRLRIGRFSKRLVKSLAATSLGWEAASRLRPAGAIVLLYHRISARGDRFPGLPVEHFAAQMRWLVARCRPIAPEQLDEAASSAGTSRPPVLVTFDDGYRCYRERAYPIMKELGIPGLLFLTTAYIDEPHRLFWWDTLRAAVEASTHDAIEWPWAPGSRVPLAGIENRERLLVQAKRHFKGVSNDRREADLALLLERLGRPDHGGNAHREMMTWDDVKAVLDITRLGGHSHTHPLFAHVDDVRLEAEVGTCRDRLRSETGLTPRWFAYPNGSFDERCRKVLTGHGFDTAFTTIPGVVKPGADRQTLRRFSSSGTPSELAWRLSVQARG
jgi:peptidoglycan/xylan/chitin deacetylase (PgdA/CDA1 family)